MIDNTRTDLRNSIAEQYYLVIKDRYPSIRTEIRFSIENITDPIIILYNYMTLEFRQDNISILLWGKLYTDINPWKYSIETPANYAENLIEFIDTLLNQK